MEFFGLLHPKQPTQSLSLMLLSALALILVWDAFNEVQFVQRLSVVIKKRAGEVLLKYCYAGGRKLKGLIRRRIAEHALLMSRGIIRYGLTKTCV